MDIARSKGEQTRQKLLNQALIMTEVSGVEGISMRQLAARVGLTPMAIYRHFPDKAALQKAVLEEAFRVFEVHLRDSRKVGTPIEQLCELANNFMRFAHEKPHHFSLLFLATDNPRSKLGRSTVLAAAQPTFKILKDAVKACKFEPVDCNSTLNETTVEVLAFAVGQAALFLSGNLSLDSNEFLRRFENSFLRYVQSISG